MSTEKIALFDHAASAPNAPADAAGAVTDEQLLDAVMAFSQAGKRGCSLDEAIKCAIMASVLAEREACAKLCDQADQQDEINNGAASTGAAANAAAAIRARSTSAAAGAARKEPMQAGQDGAAQERGGNG